MPKKPPDRAEPAEARTDRRATNGTKVSHAAPAATREELLVLNAELTALNSQLREALALQRMTSSDSQNVLYSTDVATILLDTALNIRLFTPAAKLLFKIVSSDIGRPLAELGALSADAALLTDARAVLRTHAPVEREIEAHSGAWYIRRILPYRTQDDAVEGVVITFVDSSERRHAADTLEAANRHAQLATIAKSRFLAAASHDLRQPLQTLVLLQGSLEKSVKGEKAQKLVARLDETVGVMSGMLNTLLDINQIDSGVVSAEIFHFPVNDLLLRLKDEFTYQAQAQARPVSVRVVPCSLSVESDPRLLEQMIRNLLSNALKYTEAGEVLLGCRRHGDKLRIEVCDTGIGIPRSELAAIFDEYHQIDNSARERSRGLGLGLSIVSRLGKLLNHKVSVQSTLGKGSIFSIEVALHSGDGAVRVGETRKARADVSVEEAGRGAEILIVEDDPEVRDLLETLLKDEGYEAITAPDGFAALRLVSDGLAQPDIILADYNLPNGMDGLQVTAKVREHLGRQIPVVVLTGDISTATTRDIALENCARLNKPVKLTELTQVIQRLLAAPKAVVPPRLPPEPAREDGNPGAPIIFVIDDDPNVREAIQSVLEEDGRSVKSYASGEEFLAAYRPGREACLLVDAYLPGISGLELLQRLRTAGHQLSAIMITGHSDVPMAVRAMKAGAIDFIEKPVSRSDLLAGVARALEQSKDAGKLSAWREDAARRLAGLTARQREVMDMILAGQANKNIAADLGISQRTVENHRAAIMEKTGSKSLPALARLAVAAAAGPETEIPV